MNLELVRAINRVLTSNTKQPAGDNTWELFDQGPMENERHVLNVTYFNFYSTIRYKNREVYHSWIGPAYIDKNVHYYIYGDHISKDVWLFKREMILNEYRIIKSIQQSAK